MEHIALICRISSDHSKWGEDRIADELAIHNIGLVFALPDFGSRTVLET
jgi:hypothetical protein